LRVCVFSLFVALSLVFPELVDLIDHYARSSFMKGSYGQPLSLKLGMYVRFLRCDGGVCVCVCVCPVVFASRYPLDVRTEGAAS
jgi:hypothetical protein